MFGATYSTKLVTHPMSLTNERSGSGESSSNVKSEIYQTSTSIILEKISFHLLNIWLDTPFHEIHHRGNGLDSITFSLCDITLTIKVSFV